MATKNKSYSLLDEYLSALGVPHTATYSAERMNNLPFKTLFGFDKLLDEYGIESEAYMLEDKGELTKLTPPFLANTAEGEVIVTNLSPDTIEYISEGNRKSIALTEFNKLWDGVVFLSFPDTDAQEPDYNVHKRIDFFIKSKKWILCACAVILSVYLFIVNGLYMHLSAYFIAAIDIAGLYFSYLLVQKSLNIHNPAADRVCGVLQAGGCDSILETKASKFFGIFGWSEVGFAYFSVSLITMLLLPGMMPWLALCNLCCLPFSFWSIWYQRFRAHKWCTLCVCVQASLWLLFFSYLYGGWIKMAWPLSLNFFALGVAYVAVMLAINAIMPYLEHKE